MTDVPASSVLRTYYVQHEVVTQARGAVNPDQNAVFQGGAEADGQPIRPGARPLIGWPVEGDEAASFAKDVRGPSCTEEGGGIRTRNTLGVCAV